MPHAFALHFTTLLLFLLAEQVYNRPFNTTRQKPGFAKEPGFLLP